MDPGLRELQSYYSRAYAREERVRSSVNFFFALNLPRAAFWLDFKAWKNQPLKQILDFSVSILTIWYNKYSLYGSDNLSILPALL